MHFFRSLVVAICMPVAVLSAAERPRLAVLTDIGGDPDDQQSMIRLMVYSNEFDLELLIASAAGTPGELKESITRTDLIHQIIDAYGEVLPNLQRHAEGWPAAQSLHALVTSGNPLRGRGHIGAGHDTPASRALIDRIDAGTPERPLNITIWGGQTDLAQALWRVKHDRGAGGLATFVRRFRVYDIADQDGIAEWMRTEFPAMSYILAKAPAGRDRREAVFRGMYLTGDESLTSRAWIDEHVRSRGPLGTLYPTKTWTAPNPHATMKEGDTPSWFFFLPLGGNNPADPTQPGWGGQFVRERDGWFRDPAAEAGQDPRESVSRWRPEFQRDFAKRMAWSVLASAPLAANWPQWRGPSSLAVSAESDLPTTWSDRENIAWSAALRGLGSSSPVVWGDQVFVTSQIGRVTLSGGPHPALARDDAALVSREKPIGGERDDRAGVAEPILFVVESFSRSDGRRLWEHRIEARGPFPTLHEKHNLATPTVVTSGEHLFAWFGTGQIVALDMRGGVVWSKHLGEEYSPFDINWGHGSSPVLYKDLLILLCDHESASYLIALDARTGKQRWKADRGKGRASYSTPLIVPGPSGDELLVNSTERIDGYDPATGELLWYADAPRQSPVPSAVFHDGLIYMTRGYRNSPYLAIRPGGRGDVTASHVVWRAPGGGSYAASLVAYDGLLYLTNDVGVLTCADAKTGARIWQTRLDGVFFSSPVAADGKVYFLSQTGETIVVKAGRTPAILARNDLGERLMASPAISGGLIFLRSDGRLFAIGRVGSR